MRQPVAIGMDIGGTHVCMGAFDSSGQLIGQHESGIASIGPDNGLRLIEQLIHQLLDSIDSPDSSITHTRLRGGAMSRPLHG